MSKPQSIPQWYGLAAIWILIGSTALAAEPAGSSLNGAEVPKKDGAASGDANGDSLLIETLRRNLRELTETLDKTRAEVQKLKAELQSLRGDNESLTRDLGQKVSAIKAVTESLAVSQTELELFREQNEKLRVQLQMLGGQIKGDSADLEKKFADAVRALEQSEKEQAQLRVQLKRLIEIVEALLPAKAAGPDSQKLREMVLTELEKAKQAANGGAGQPAPAVAAGVLEKAKVIRVNGDLQLVVLNVGRAQGVKMGMPLMISRNGKPIAKVRVVDVREGMCGAMISESQKQPELDDAAAVQPK